MFVCMTFFTGFHACIFTPQTHTANKKVCYLNPSFAYSLHLLPFILSISFSRHIGWCCCSYRLLSGAIGDRIRDCLAWSGLAIQNRTISLFSCLGPAYVYSLSHTLIHLSVCVCVCVDINRVLEDLCFFLDFLDLRVVVRYGAGGKTTVCAVCACSSVCGSLCVLILIFRRALLSTPTCVNTPADQMADNDFQIDTLHSTSRENQ